MRCPECGVGLGSEAEYCPVCGAKVGETRPYVPRHLAPGSMFDGECGPDDGDDLDESDDSDESDESDEPDESDEWNESDVPDEWNESDVPDEWDEWDEPDDRYGSDASYGPDGPYAFDVDDGDGFVEPEPWEFEEPEEWAEPERPHPARRVLTYIGVVVAVGLMVVLTLPMASSPAGRAPVVFSTPVGLYPNEVTSSEVTQREVLERADELGITAWTDWTPTFGEDGCLTPECAQQATDLLNLYRFVAGVEPVALSLENDVKAQAVVDVYAGIEFQAHTLTQRPATMDAATFAMAQEAAQRSNVGVGYGNWGQDLPAYIAEVDPNPIQPNYETVGHRRHLLGTSLADVGFGLNGPYSAIYIGDFDGGRVDGTVAWPACQTPTGLWIQGSPWSVSLPYEIEDDEAVGVRIVRERDGRVWETADMAHLFVDHGSYHDASAVVFTPADLLVERGDRYEVTLEGLPNGPLTYVATFFDMGFDLR